MSLVEPNCAFFFVNCLCLSLDPYVRDVRFFDLKPGFAETCSAILIPPRSVVNPTTYFAISSVTSPSTSRNPCKNNSDLREIFRPFVQYSAGRSLSLEISTIFPAFFRRLQSQIWIVIFRRESCLYSVLKKFYAGNNLAQQTPKQRTVKIYRFADRTWLVGLRF
jgi:hypothetical protein